LKNLPVIEQHYYQHEVIHYISQVQPKTKVDGEEKIRDLLQKEEQDQYFCLELDNNNSHFYYSYQQNINLYQTYNQSINE
jgi:hypothetical protein